MEDHANNYKHELKSWVGLFEPLATGAKTHDVRVMDRDFQVGDVCWVREYEPIAKKYTGRSLFYEITYITSSKHQGVCIQSKRSPLRQRSTQCQVATERELLKISA